MALLGSYIVTSLHIFNLIAQYHRPVIKSLAVESGNLPIFFRPKFGLENIDNFDLRTIGKFPLSTARV